MPLPVPNLDDRDFTTLVEQARQRVSAACPGWTDLSPSDPGSVLLEAFAFLTETLIYRVNRLPEKAYVEFLRLLGVTLHPPSGAVARLRFERGTGLERALEVPRGTRVSVQGGGSGGEAPMFVTTRAVTFGVGEAAAEVLAQHAEVVAAELAGHGTGLPGQAVQARRAPLLAPSGDELDLVVGVEAAPGELDERQPAREHAGKSYRVWREVEHFARLDEGACVYVADRLAGRITFAPGARLPGPDGLLEERERPLAAVPAAGREIRLWYRRGGGPDGNVAAGTLTVLKDTLPGLRVTNPQAAAGGRAAESVENALRRGPLELHSLQRTVTAQDFELVARRASGAVARAKALTQAALWRHAVPGTVEVLLVPELPAELRIAGEVDSARLRAAESDSALQRVAQVLDERRPLGTRCIPKWARYKTVTVHARVVAQRAEDAGPLRARVLQRLRRTLSPLPAAGDSGGWGFGQSLRASHVYDIVLAEPGVSYVDQVRFEVDEAPEAGVTSLCADAFQARTFFASAGDALYRTANDGEGWELLARFPGEAAELVRAHPDVPGHLVLVTHLATAGGACRLHVSRDCGESFEPARDVSFQVRDVAFSVRRGVPVLLLATDVGLYELLLVPGATPVPVLVDAADPDLPLYALAAVPPAGLRGDVHVAVAAQGQRGVYLSREGGRPGSFRPIGLQGEDVRVLAVQLDGPRAFLWAGVYAAAGDAGKGCFAWELRLEDPPEGWRAFAQGWNGGSCFALAFRGGHVAAATHRAGVVEIEPTRPGAGWQSPEVNCGLPLRDPGRFHPVDSVCADPQGRVLLSAGLQGIQRRAVEAPRYEPVSRREFTNQVTLPETWLFCSGAHDVSVVSEDALSGD